MNYKKLRIAIIIVNWNRKQETLECLNSVNALSIVNCQLSIILIDNASADGSQEAIRKKFPGTKILKNRENLGFGQAVNLGLNYALKNKFDYALLLNNDTIVSKNFLTPLVDFCQKNTNIGAVSPLILNTENKIWFAGGKIIWPITRPTHQKTIRNTNPYQTDFLSGCCILISRKTLEKIGFLDPDYFLYYEDVDWSKRMTDAGLNLYILPQVAIKHKIAASTGGTASPLAVYYTTRNNLRFIKKFQPFPVNLFAYLYVVILVLKIGLTKSNLRKASFFGMKDFIAGKFGRGEIF